MEIARLLVELAMQSLLMRDTLQDVYDLRREQRRELLELRMKFKRWAYTAACCTSVALPAILACPTCTRTAMVASHLHRLCLDTHTAGEICILTRACRNDSACVIYAAFQF